MKKIFIDLNQIIFVANENNNQTHGKANNYVHT